MSGIATRFRRAAAGFSARADAVPDGRWEDPAPCEGWVARDVVRHLVEWMPGLFLEPYGLPTPATDVDADPAGAWRSLAGAIQAALDDPEVAAREADIFPGRFPLAQAFEMFGLADVIIHTWDLARATGLDERLDPDEVRGLLEGMAPAEEAMRASGHFGPRVEVPAGAGDQDRLLAFTGRTP